MLIFCLRLNKNASLRQSCIRQYKNLNCYGALPSKMSKNKEWYNRSVFEKLEQVYREENGVDTVDFLYDNFLELIILWQKQGKMRKDIDSKMIMMVFAAVINVDTHKEEIGIEYFPELLHLMAELIMNGLKDCSE